MYNLVAGKSYSLIKALLKKIIMNSVKAGISNCTDLRITTSEVWRCYFVINTLRTGDADLRF